MINERSISSLRVTFFAIYRLSDGYAVHCIMHCFCFSASNNDAYRYRHELLISLIGFCGSIREWENAIKTPMMSSLGIGSYGIKYI